MKKNKFGFNSKSAQEKRAKEHLDKKLKEYEWDYCNLKKKWDEEGREYTEHELAMQTTINLENRGIL